LQFDCLIKVDHITLQTVHNTYFGLSQTNVNIRAN